MGKNREKIYNVIIMKGSKIIIMFIFIFIIILSSTINVNSTTRIIRQYGDEFFYADEGKYLKVDNTPENDQKSEDWVKGREIVLGCYFTDNTSWIGCIALWKFNLSEKDIANIKHVDLEIHWRFEGGRTGLHSPENWTEGKQGEARIFISDVLIATEKCNMYREAAPGAGWYDYYANDVNETHFKYNINQLNLFEEETIIEIQVLNKTLWNVGEIILFINIKDNEPANDTQSNMILILFFIIIISLIGIIIIFRSRKKEEIIIADPLGERENGQDETDKIFKQLEAHLDTYINEQKETLLKFGQRDKKYITKDLFIKSLEWLSGKFSIDFYKIPSQQKKEYEDKLVNVIQTVAIRNLGERLNKIENNLKYLHVDLEKLIENGTFKREVNGEIPDTKTK